MSKSRTPRDLGAFSLRLSAGKPGNVSNLILGEYPEMTLLSWPWVNPSFLPIPEKAVAYAEELGDIHCGVIGFFGDSEAV